MYFDLSRVCYIDGRAGELRRRGYVIHDPGTGSTFKQTCYLLYRLNGIPADLFVPIIAAGRLPGWTVSVRKQMENDILIRPLTHYFGPQPLDYVPLERR